MHQDDSIMAEKLQQQAAGKNRKLRDHVFYHKQEAKRMNWKWSQALTSQVHAQWQTSSSKAAPPPFSFKQPQAASHSSQPGWQSKVLQCALWLSYCGWQTILLGHIQHLFDLWWSHWNKPDKVNEEFLYFWAVKVTYIVSLIFPTRLWGSMAGKIMTLKMFTT